MYNAKIVLIFSITFQLLLAIKGHDDCFKENGSNFQTAFNDSLTVLARQFEPFTMAKDRSGGIEHILLQAIGKRLNKKIEFIYYDGQSHFESGRNEAENR